MSLQTRLPWTKSPLIINAPVQYHPSPPPPSPQSNPPPQMGGHATAPLAIAVTLAGGHGQIGSVSSIPDLTANLAACEAALPRHGPNNLLPIGVGLLPFILDLDAALPVLARYRPATVWLFATAQLADYAKCARRIREASPGSQIWIQTGSVSAAVAIAEQARPDVLCIQGLDAGGHGLEKGAGLTSLLPEVADALVAAGHGDIALVAAGGLAEGRGAAAAFALGAQGVVMGTRFLGALETALHPAFRAAVLAAGDGGQNTVRAKVFDELRGPNIWPEGYDGRSILSESYSDHIGGVGMEEIRRLHADAAKGEDGGYGVDGKGRTAMWAGTGVGLVRREQGAAEIVEEVRREVGEALRTAQARL